MKRPGVSGGGGIPQSAELDLVLCSGTVHARRHGPPDASLVLCVHGLSANLRSFDYLAERIASPYRQVVAFDLRGRGRSQITPPGSYGLVAHARDVLEVAELLGAERFDYVGWSLGALIGITVAGLAGERLNSLTLIDHANREDCAAQAAVRNGLSRLDVVVEDPTDYLNAVRSSGLIAPWNEYWERAYCYELGRQGDRFSPVTDRAACLEDLDHPDRAHVAAAWAKVTMSTLLLRATAPLGGGLVVSDTDVMECRQAAPRLRVVELESNHFGIMTDDCVVAAISELLTGAEMDSAAWDR